MGSEDLSNGLNGQELELLSRAMTDVKGPEYWRFVADRYNELADKLNPGEKEKLKKIESFEGPWQKTW